MGSAVAPESRRAQASASSMMTSAMVSMPMICANGYAFSNQGGTASCFFLVGRSVGDGFGQSLRKGLAWALWARISSFPPTSTSFLFLNLGKVSHLHPCGLGWAFQSGGLPALAGPCRSPGGVQKLRSYISHS